MQWRLSGRTGATVNRAGEREHAVSRAERHGLLMRFAPPVRRERLLGGVTAEHARARGEHPAVRLLRTRCVSVEKGRQLQPSTSSLKGGKRTRQFRGRTPAAHPLEAHVVDIFVVGVVCKGLLRLLPEHAVPAEREVRRKAELQAVSSTPPRNLDSAEVCSTCRIRG